MRAETVSILKRLSKGKAALSPDELAAFCRDVGSASKEEILTAVAKRVSAKKAVSKPAWLIEMETAKKKLSWSSAAEAARKLIEIAADEGFIRSDLFAGRKAPPTFPIAAKRIAKEVGGERLAAAYGREIARLEREFRLG